MRWSRLFGLLLVGACTPLGLWLYEDPVVTVSHIRLELGSRPQARSPIVVALSVQNRNDYPLSAERVELSLRLNGMPVGRLKRDGIVPVATDTVSTLPLPLRLERQVTAARLSSLQSGIHLFAVRGKATFRTPIGVRNVRFAQEGEMAFGERVVDSTP
jgi:LEA14-like dessication related protein